MSTGNFLRRLFGNGVDTVDRRVHELMSHCRALLAESGEYASMAIASDALAAYHALDERAREAFFDLLVSRYSPAPDAVVRAAALYQSNPSPEKLIELQAIVEPERQELFRRLNMAPGGTAALVEMRKTLLKGLREHPAWKLIDFDLMHLLRSWFNRGFLRLERIDWRTPALVLEKLIDYEAVHAIRGWWDLRRRLEGDRRCFAFFHPQLPDEPIIFIEVALTRGMSAQVQPLLDKGATLERLNWMGDSSEQGMSRAAGLMVNYVYWLAELEKNHERYFREHFITASPLIERLAREAPVLPAVEKGAA